jgi:hypothetical protein
MKMLRSIKNLSEYRIESIDGNIGHVDSFLFDDRDWTIRYLVVDTGTWLPGRKVLIVPSALGEPEGQVQVFPVELTRDEIENSPDIDTDKSVSREHEIELHKYYDWAPYWAGSLGSEISPYTPAEQGEEKEAQGEGATKTKQKGELHLRSTHEVIGYRIHAEDGLVGHIDDLIVHEKDWMIRYLVADTGKWLPGRKVLIPPDWIKHIDWRNSEAVANVKKEVIKGSPSYDPGAPVNREYEIRLYDYYGRPKYWL